MKNRELPENHLVGRVNSSPAVNAGKLSHIKCESSTDFEQAFIDTVCNEENDPFQKHQPCFVERVINIIDRHTSKGGLKHKTDCSRSFGRYDSTCERCRELMTGAEPRKGWKF